MADALSAHDRALKAGPGRDGIADRGLILSAINRPYTGYYRPIARKLAALVQSMADNHGFIDGNKRTTVLLTSLLIERSGYQLEGLEGEDLDDQVLENLVLRFVCRQIGFDDLVA